MSKKPREKPKQKRKPHRRRDFVVQKVLRAARAELRARGPASFRVESVAKAADVNKTTIYRRWPTKELLLKAALAQSEAPARDDVKSGSEEPASRAEFLRLSAEYLDWMGSDVGRGIARAGRESGLGPALKKLIREWEEARRKPLARFMRRRGTPGGIRSEVFLHAWIGALGAYAGREELHGRALEALADLLLGREPRAGA